VSALVGRRPGPAVRRVAGDIERACRDSGFFYVVGHGVPAELLSRLDTAGRRFFRLLTLLAQDADGGLQVRSTSGRTCRRSPARTASI